MNKLTKVGCSALCGSLAVISAANAGELTVTGGADLTFVSLGRDTTGNPIGMGSNYTLKGSGELDNGFSYDLSIAIANGGAYSATTLNMDMGSFGKLNLDQGSSANGIQAYDDKMPTAWEEATGAGMATGVRKPTGSGTSNNIMYTTPTILGTHMTFTLAPEYGATDTGDKSSTDAGTANKRSYDATININPSLGTEILSGLNIFGGATTIESVEANNGSIADRYEGVAGFTYDIGPISLGAQVSGDYTGVDDAGDADATQVYNFYKAKAFGVALNVNDDFSVSYGEWEARKSGYSASLTNQIAEGMRTIVVSSWQAAYTMGGASMRVASVKADNVAWGTNANDDKSATIVSLGLAF